MGLCGPRTRVTRADARNHHPLARGMPNVGMPASLVAQGEWATCVHTQKAAIELSRPVAR